ncbi:MAG: hypothetical protein M1832_000102 [Thelocarpon impressellum]|nr:MAG: hypothetical protein M1832_000102 [Thelocarpon impressellum]
MIGRRAQRPSARDLPLKTASLREPSPSCSVVSDCDADDEGAMSSEDQLSSRPLSVAIPQAPYCPRRPTLAEILSNTAPPPWTLTAFMAYLSQNHCLETLEFTMDATRYRNHFNQMRPPGPAGADGPRYVMMLWRRLLDAYIIPDGPREVNLPSEVRDRLLALPNSLGPPPPDSLEPAVKIIYDLMDESVLVPFLNSVSGYRDGLPPGPLGRGSDSDTDVQASGDELPAAARTRPRRSRRGSSPASVHEFMSGSFGQAAGHHRGRISRTTTNLMTAGGLAQRAGRMSPRGSNVSTTSGDNLTDDSGSPSSPGHEPMTPPTTPPTSDAGGVSPGVSPRSGDNTWKKMTGKLGFKKPSASSTSTSSSRPGPSRDGRTPGFDDDAGGLL